MLEIDNVSYRYDRSRPVLEGYSGSVRQGDFIALVGPNGGGKTTLLKLIRGLLKPDRGRIFWRDQEVKAAKLKLLAGEIGYVFQNPDHQLFAETVLDEVSLGVRWLGFDRKEVGERADQALRTVGLNGKEGDIFRRVVVWSLVFLVAMCAISALQASAVLSWMVP